MKCLILLGTRPEIIKLSPVVRACQKYNVEYFIVHSNQHYDKEMDSLIFQELGLPNPKYNLGVGSLSHAKMTAKILEKIEPILIQEKPDWIIVQGDTNTVLAGSLAASKLGVKIAHIEAGLRSYDRAMPEEINRIATDHISDYLFSPTTASTDNLLKEGISSEKIFTIGNTIVDSVYQGLEIANKKINFLDDFGLKKGKYILMTLHRPSNVDHKDTLESILTGLEEVSKSLELPIIFPVHPRTSQKLSIFNLLLSPQFFKKLPPLGFLEMLQLEAGAGLIVTDSGGVQEEACILKVPCLTLRENTERPETVEVGGSILVRPDSELINNARIMLEKNREWDNPFGSGTSAEEIIKTLLMSK